jgi:hypothetical protein
MKFGRSYERTITLMWPSEDIKRPMDYAFYVAEGGDGLIEIGSTPEEAFEALRIAESQEEIVYK